MIVFFEVLSLLFTVIYYCLRSAYRAVIPAPKKPLVDHIALVTGAGHGIGRELARKLARLGVKVVCWDINLESCQRTVNDIKAEGFRQTWAFYCDVSDRRSVAKATAETK